jgi:hypothetical protein
VSSDERGWFQGMLNTGICSAKTVVPSTDDHGKLFERLRGEDGL